MGLRKVEAKPLQFRRAKRAGHSRLGAVGDVVILHTQTTSDLLPLIARLHAEARMGALQVPEGATLY